MRNLRRLLMSLAVVAVVAVVAVLALGAAAQQNQINTVVGGGPNDMPALDADLYGPYQVALDGSGNFYFASYYQNRVFKVTSSGLLTVVAGNGLPGYSGDGVTGGAAQAMLSGPEGVAVDGNGNVYIADTSNFVIRKVDTTNTITTVAGVQGSCGYNGDGSPATSFNLCYPYQLAVDSSNNVYIADYSDSLIRKLTVGTNTISTVAGNYGAASAYCPNGTLATTCGLGGTPAVAVDSTDDIFLTDAYACVVYKVTNSTGKISTIAGNNALGCGYNGDAITATSAQIDPNTYGQLAVNSAGTRVWLADYYNSEVRQIAVGGNINVAAGSYSVCAYNISGIGGPATSACVGYPVGIAADSAGDLFLTDGYYYTNEYVFEVPCSLGGTCTPPAGDTADYVYIVAGNGSTNDATPVNGVPALGVTLYDAAGVYQDPSGNIIISDTDNQFVRELLNSSGDVNDFAGSGTAGYGGDGGSATAPAAQVSYPGGIAHDASGNIFFADQYNHIIREVDVAGTVSTFAGTPQTGGYSGDGGPATSALLYYPADVFVDNYGNMIIADTDNHVIREVVCATTGIYPCTPPAGKTAGNIYTVAGNQAAGGGYSGDGGPATSAKLYLPNSAALDGAGNLYIADTNNHRIREVNASTQIINTVAGNGTVGFSGDGPALENSLNAPNAVRADNNGNIFIADSSNYRMRWVDGGGTLTTFAGNGTDSFSGDGGPAISAELYFPNALFEDASGDFLISDSYNYRIRKINAFAAVGRSTGSLGFGLSPVGTTATPQAVTLSGIGPAAISSITASGDFSEVDDCTGNLPNNSACTVYVYFTPTGSGLRSGVLTINSNGYFSSVSTVALQGEGEGLSLSGTLAFGSVSLNTSLTKSVTLTNAGSTSVTISSITLTETTDYAFSGTSTCPLTGGSLASKAKCTIFVTFTPHTTGAKKGTLVVNSKDPASPLLLGYSGTGSSFESFTPASVTFAATVLNTPSKATKVTFKYSGTGSLTLTSLVASANYSLNTTGLTGACNLSGSTVLAAGANCVFNVVFTPTAINTVPGTVTASFTGDPNNNTLVLPLTGVGIEVTFSPASLSFGNVVHGTSKSLNLTVKNVSGSNTLHVTGTSFTGTYASVYSVTANTCSSVSPGTTCTLTVKYSPTAVSTGQKAVLNVTDDGGGSPQLVNVTGNGT